MESYKEKVVVITGGATGIGFSFAKQFGNEGAKIVIAGRRENKVNDAVQKLSELGFEAKARAATYFPPLVATYFPPTPYVT